MPSMSPRRGSFTRVVNKRARQASVIELCSQMSSTVWRTMITTIQRVENVALTAMIFVAFVHFGFPWWTLFGMFLVYDLSALAYLKEDRKSTRLNSSHVAISYAVFCLK